MERKTKIVDWSNINLHVWRKNSCRKRIYISLEQVYTSIEACSISISIPLIPVYSWFQITEILTYTIKWQKIYNLSIMHVQLVCVSLNIQKLLEHLWNITMKNKKEKIFSWRFSNNFKSGRQNHTNNKSWASIERLEILNKHFKAIQSAEPTHVIKWLSIPNGIIFLHPLNVSFYWTVEKKRKEAFMKKCFSNIRKFLLIPLFLFLIFSDPTRSQTLLRFHNILLAQSQIINKIKKTNLNKLLLQLQNEQENNLENGWTKIPSRTFKACLR